MMGGKHGVDESGVWTGRTGNRALVRRRGAQVRNMGALTGGLKSEGRGFCRGMEMV